MNATLSRARLKLQLDVSFGASVTPAPAPIEYPLYLTDETFTLYGYPIATVIAENSPPRCATPPSTVASGYARSAVASLARAGS
jgi:hypothetical protein